MINPKQMEIWMVNLDPKIGSEIGKLRPVVVISNDNFGALPLKWIVPITEWKDNFYDKFWIIKIKPSNLNNLTKISGIDVFQIKSLDKLRFQNRIGTIDSDLYNKIKMAINLFIEL
jgi:mRNA interferase MazF